ncbi:BTB/POZ protein [Sporodiniella umbellata]|nr:BTB/POZ protein [Sporodiniella umbellata]
MDPLEFFDRLANPSVSSFKDQEWYELEQEKQGLYQQMEQQLQTLQTLDSKSEEENDALHQQMMERYDTLSNDIQQHQNLLRIEKRQYEKEKVWIADLRQCQDEKIKLNVGGQLFQTSLSTLRRDPHSLLAVMFGDPKTVQPDADQSYFIDRDGTYFRLVLNYLRDLKVPASVIHHPKIMDELMQEAQFYKLKDLLALQWQGLPSLTQHELHTLYPTSHKPVVFHLVRRDLSNLDFSNYWIDAHSSFSGSNLAHARLDQARFDLTQPIDFRNANLQGTLFPKNMMIEKEGTAFLKK